MTALRRNQEPAESTATPIWAPNPGVPLVARVLAYTFGALMLLTLLATCMTKQAPDVPPIPKQWDTYRTRAGIAIAYPRGWAVDKGDDPGVEQIIFSLMPGSNVHIEAIVNPTTGKAGYMEIQQFNERVEDLLPPQFKGFAWEGEDGISPTIPGRVFTFTTDRRPMTGGWMIVSRKQALFCLIGIAPREGWDAMRVIVSQMAAQLSQP